MESAHRSMQNEQQLEASLLALESRNAVEAWKVGTGLAGAGNDA